MIVVGVDVHKHSLTAVAVDELGHTVAETRGPVDSQVIVWGRSLEGERLWAVEDCRHVTRDLEQALTAAGERLVRVPPRLTAPGTSACAVLLRTPPGTDLLVGSQPDCVTLWPEKRDRFYPNQRWRVPAQRSPILERLRWPPLDAEPCVDFG